jgi:NADH-quinone oxidoreductase subunit L
MPTTFLTFLVGYLALAGIPPFSGFWSKDAILDHAFHANRTIWVLGLGGVFLTALYMTRVMKVAFGGKWRGRSGEPHESPRIMTGPLVALAALAVGAGWVGTPMANGYGRYVHLGAAVESSAITGEMAGLMGLSAAIALAGIAVGVWLYPDGQFRCQGLASSPVAMGWYNWSYNEFYFDELYRTVLVIPMLAMSRFAALFDNRLIDGAVNAVGWLTLQLSQLYRLIDIYVVDNLVNLAGWIPRQLGRSLRYAQTGQVQTYLLGLCLGAIVLFWLFLTSSRQ